MARPRSKVRCRKCGFKAKTAAGLSGHMRSHAKKPSYPCESCAFVSVTAQGRASHTRIVHEGFRIRKPKRKPKRKRVARVKPLVLLNGSNVKFCPYCAAKIAKREDVRYCVACGYKIEAVLKL